MSRTFDYVNRIWMNGNLFFVNGCTFCGQEKRDHCVSGFCNGKGNTSSKYVAPDDEIILMRMKYNRAQKTVK